MVMSLCPSDASLTPNNVLAALKRVEAMDTLGGVLKVPHNKNEELREQSKTEPERRELLVRYFLQTFPSASWAKIGGELQYWEEEEAFQQVKGRVKPHEGVCVGISDPPLTNYENKACCYCM
jgi:hypothetical protein